MFPVHYHDAKIGEHRDGARVYLQTVKLQQSGLNPDTPYTAQVNGHTIVITPQPDGDRRVCKRERGGKTVPVIDLSGKWVRQTFGASASRVRVKYAKGRVEIDLHPLERRIAEREAAILDAAQNGTLQIGSLCTGIGVLNHASHEGLCRAGLDAQTAFAVEINEDYLESAVQNNPALHGASTFCMSLDDVDTRDLPAIHIEEIGIPCTAASFSGRSKQGLARAEDDPDAGHLFVPALESIKATNPAVVVLENVMPYATTASMSVFRTCMDKMGYRLFELELDGSLYSLEKRKRFCMIGVSRGIAPEEIEVAARRTHSTIAEILEDIPDDSSRWKEYFYLAAKEERDKEAGKGFRQQVLTPEATEVGTIGAGYNKVRSTEPRMAHPSGNGLTRLFTPKEHARIKGIPESFIDGMCETQAHEVLGNSIIHEAFAAVFESLGKHIASLAQALPKRSPVRLPVSAPAQPAAPAAWWVEMARAA